MMTPHSQSFELPRMRWPVVVFGTRLLTTALWASTIDSDDMRSRNVENDVTGMLRIGLRCCPVCGFVHASCGKGPTTDRPL